jgi:hypothetical protein
MPPVLLVRIDWDRTAIPLHLPGWHQLHVGPEPVWPFGRKGLALTRAWRQLAGAKFNRELAGTPAGMLLLDGDVAVDPLDVRAMMDAVEETPGAVLVAPVRLWPVSTKIPRWVWGHGRGEFGQDDVDDPDCFTFCFTYLPAALIEACIAAGLDEWAYPEVDRAVVEVARKTRAVVRVVRGAAPKHLHY